jgi:hypothetical protein
VGAVHQNPDMRRPRLLALALLLTITASISGCGSDARDRIEGAIPDRTTTVPGETAPEETAPPETAPPETTPGETAPPETAPPETAPPETAPPETAPPETAPPETAAPDTTPPVGPDDTPTDSDDTSSGPWLWVLLGLVAVGAIAAVVLQRSRRRSALQTRTRQALTQTVDLSRSLATVAPPAAQMVAAQDAARLAALGVELQAIAAETADDGAKQAIDQVRAQVQVLHGVTDSVALSAVPPSDAAGAYLREQATVLHTIATRTMAQLYPPPAP